MWDGLISISMEHDGLERDGLKQGSFRCIYLEQDGLRWDAWDAIAMDMG